MKIGIIGAESKHVEFFGKPINKDKLFGQAKIHYIWGGDTTQNRLYEATDLAGIQTIMNTPESLIRESDAVIITLRNGDLHADYAIECLRQHKPVFIDKPFTVKLEDAKNIINASARYRTPFTGGSTLSFLPEIHKLQNIHKAASYTEISYRADPYSPFGGWHYYGSHLTDLYSAICGTDPCTVEATMNNNEVIADIYYTDKNHDYDYDRKQQVPHFSRHSYVNKKVRIYSAPDLSKPNITIDKTYILNDKVCYIHGLRAFFDMISTGKSIGALRLLYSVHLLDAILSSIASGSPSQLLLHKAYSFSDY